MTLRTEGRRLWIIHFSPAELIICTLILAPGVFAFGLPEWVVVVPCVVGLLFAVHVSSFQPGRPTVIRQYFCLVPHGKVEVHDPVVTVLEDDWGDGKAYGIDVADRFISCDRPQEVAEWLRSRLAARVPTDRGIAHP